MTLRLILTRHAKSAWDTPASGDHDRPLSERGRKAANALGIWMEANGHRPDLVLSSDAARTRETWSLIAPALVCEPETKWLDALYLAPAQVMLDVLKHAYGQSVIMLGHNPGIASFANTLVRQQPDHKRFRDYPTGATTVIDFDTNEWREVDWGQGIIANFVVPRELRT